jgi:flavin-binding protein dodecin
VNGSDGVTKLDVKIDKGKIVAYRARVQVSFKYEG